MLVTCKLVCLAFQITRQIKGHEGSVFCMCEMRSGSVLTGGGKDRKIILWDHELRADRDIEVAHSHTQAAAVWFANYIICEVMCVVDRSQISMGPSEQFQRGREMNSWSERLVISSWEERSMTASWVWSRWEAVMSSWCPCRLSLAQVMVLQSLVPVSNWTRLMPYVVWA